MRTKKVLVFWGDKTGGKDVKMAAKDILNEVISHIEPVFLDSGYTLVDIEFVKEGPNWYLRIFADKEGGITIDDCEIISRKVEAILDEKDPIEQAYILEVSSPGIDRPLKTPEDFHQYTGEIVDVKLYKAVDKSKEFQGKLVGLMDNVVTIEDEEGNILRFNKDEIVSVRLAVIF